MQFPPAEFREEPILAQLESFETNEIFSDSTWIVFKSTSCDFSSLSSPSIIPSNIQLLIVNLYFFYEIFSLD